MSFLKALWIVSPTMWYLFEWKKCQFKFSTVDSTVTNFRFRFNNDKSTPRKFTKKLKNGIIQEIKKSELKQTVALKRLFGCRGDECLA